jgi:hypothetical protein
MLTGQDIEENNHPTETGVMAFSGKNTSCARHNAAWHGDDYCKSRIHPSGAW